MRPAIRVLWLATGIFGVGVLGPLAAPALASTPVCGSTNQQGEVIKGTLELQKSQESFVSTTTLKFGPDTDTRNLILVYAVKGCELQNSDGILVHEVSSDVPTTAFKDPTIIPKGTYVVFEVPVAPKGFRPGTHDVLVATQGPSIVTAIQSVTLSRKESNLALVYGLFAFAVLLGIAWCGFSLYVVASESGSVGFKLPYFVLAIPAAAGAAWIVFDKTYNQSDTWALTVPAVFVLLVGCAAAAAGGSTSGVLAKAFVKQAKGQ